MDDKIKALFPALTQPDLGGGDLPENRPAGRQEVLAGDDTKADAACVCEVCVWRRGVSAKLDTLLAEVVPGRDVLDGAPRSVQADPARTAMRMALMLLVRRAAVAGDPLPVLVRAVGQEMLDTWGALGVEPILRDPAEGRG